MLRENGQAGNWTRDLSVTSPTPYRSAATQHLLTNLLIGYSVRLCPVVQFQLPPPGSLKCVGFGPKSHIVLLTALVDS